MPETGSLIERVTAQFATLPPELEGLRILHLSDLHVRRSRARHEQILASVQGENYDLLAITGDLMVKPGDELAATEVLAHFVRAARPRLGIAGVWGNHDTPDLRRRLAAVAVRWLENSAWLVPELPIAVLGVNCGYDEHDGRSGDLLAAMLDEEHHRANDEGRFRLLLTHMPIWLPAAAAAGIEFMLCGHTHAGQCRLPTGHVLYNATPKWPLRMSAGLLRIDQTQCLISRGLGEVYITGLRMFCPPHIPLITLTKGKHPVPG